MATKGIALRKWSLNASDYEDEDTFRLAVQQELAAFEHIGERLGIGLVAVPIRTRLHPDGDYYTAGWAFQTASVPAAREGDSEPLGRGAWGDPELDQPELPDEPILGVDEIEIPESLLERAE